MHRNESGNRREVLNVRVKLTDVYLHVYADSQHAFRGPTVLPVPNGVSARLGRRVTTRRGVVGAQLDLRGLAARNVRLKRQSILYIFILICSIVKLNS